MTGDAGPLPAAAALRILLQCEGREGALAGLERQPGPGSLVLCAPRGAAVATAQWVFPDRRIEVKNLFREPSFRARGPFAGLSALAWMLKPGGGDESAEATRRRVIDTGIRLTEVAKRDGEAVLVGGPLMLRLVSLKLAGIGYRGAFLRGFKPGEQRRYQFMA